MEKDKSAKGGKTIVITVILVALVVGVGAFYGGYSFAQAKKSAIGQFGNFQARGQQATSANGAAARPGTGQGSGLLNGEVISLDDVSVTVKLRAGGSKIAFFSTSTEVSKFATGAVSDLVAGTNVMITGTANADGSVIAKSIQIRPAGDLSPNLPKASQQ